MGLSLFLFVFSSLSNLSAREGHPGTTPSETAAAFAAVILAAIVGVYQLSKPGGSNVKIYSKEVLFGISPFLVSGYRSGNGVGSTFYGTLDKSWKRYSEVDRIALGIDIAKTLERRGVSELMFFDELHQIQFHYADGNLKHPIINE